MAEPTTGPSTGTPTGPSTAPAHRLRVRFFAGARAAAGTAQVDEPVLDGDRVSDVLGRLQDGRPDLARVLAACSFLLDGVSARPGTAVGGASGLDVLPPFSGG